MIVMIALWVLSVADRLVSSLCEIGPLVHCSVLSIKTLVISIEFASFQIRRFTWP